MSARSIRWHWLKVAVAGLLAILAARMPIAHAHEIRPAYLQIDEVGPGRYQLFWRTPVLSGMRLPVVLRLPDDTRELTQPATQELSDSLVERHVIDAGAKGLAGKRVEFVGLQATITDVLIRVQMLDGTHSTQLVHPSRPWIEITTPRGTLATAGVFLMQGVKHILLGVDHLLFVLGLILIVSGTRMLLLTVTGFTVAHSITLSLATLGVLHIPTPPVEACIALSILLLASEVLRRQRGEPSLTASLPWAVAFSSASAWPWLRQRADRYRASTRRRSPRAAYLQRRRRGGDSRLHRRSSRRVASGQAISNSRYL